MAPSDRLAELRRQRALVQQELARLDREIEAAQTPEPPPSPAAVDSTLPLAPSETDAEAILSRYQTDEKSVSTNVRRGCLLYAGAAFLLFVAVVLGLYFLLRH